MFDVIVIGAGPAGLAAALYTGRYRLNTLIMEKMVPGGQILLSPTIENFPGFPGGIGTQELMDRFKSQIDDLGVKVETVRVSGIRATSQSIHPVYAVETEDAVFETRSIIIATGAHWKRLGVPGEELLIGRGVSYCGTCDGPLFKNKELIIVGGGDRALEEALYLAGIASKVTIVHRRQHLRSAEILQEQVKRNPRISFILDSEVARILGDKKVEGVLVKHVHTGAEQTIPCHGVFVFIGIAPTTDFLAGAVDMDETGFIITDERMKTSREGIFACGDCREKSLYQVVTAASDGAVAAHAVHAYLLKQ
ncbi:MAG TPA: thioredoxin-disulfide reductase [Candidatus Omnitrophota bacterium]|nr:thioredoxin-disulfide reductase [Candidatus Omnitrophota bacterium]HRZ14160.1 thioredoxin-disulfide reductase [Candidatus Omnitrophota bacterium]